MEHEFGEIYRCLKEGNEIDYSNHENWHHDHHQEEVKEPILQLPNLNIQNEEEQYEGGNGEFGGIDMLSADDSLKNDFKNLKFP